MTIHELYLGQHQNVVRQRFRLRRQQRQRLSVRVDGRDAHKPGDVRPDDVVLAGRIADGQQVVEHAHVGRERHQLGQVVLGLHAQGQARVGQRRRPDLVHLDVGPLHVERMGVDGVLSRPVEVLADALVSGLCS